MKICHKHILSIFVMFGLAITATAQNNDAIALITQGVALHDQGKYADAIEKYQQALKLDPTNTQAEFEMSFSMFSSGKGAEAIPHLQKLVNDPNNTPLAAQASDILGSIYDDSQQTDKAIAAYQKGISLDPKYQRLRYNLALALVRQSKYTDAEASIVEAIKLDPKHASSQQVYAAVLQGENKNAAALIVYCNFLMLEPQTQRSVKSYQQIQSLIQSHVKVTGPKNVTITVQDSNGADKDMSALETMLSLTSANQTLDENKKKSKVELFQDQLKSIFGVAGELSAKKANKDFFWKFYADYFYKLSQSPNMPAFSRLVSLTGNQEENVKWFKDHPEYLKSLQAWVTNTSRNF